MRAVEVIVKKREKGELTREEIDFLIELTFLNGRDQLKGYDVFAPIAF